HQPQENDDADVEGTNDINNESGLEDNEEQILPPRDRNENCGNTNGNEIQQYQDVLNEIEVSSITDRTNTDSLQEAMLTDRLIIMSAVSSDLRQDINDHVQLLHSE
ncbi:unnamed protein product, partial [Didymodactylos carnosus]